MHSKHLTKKEANQVYDLLVEIGGANEDERIDFIYHHCENPIGCREWRFRGHLGFGAKYRSLWNEITYYKEDTNHERHRIKYNLNKALKKLENNVYVKITPVYNNEISELDFKLYEEFEFDYENHDSFITEGESIDGDEYPIKIETMIQELVKMKKKNVTHVEIGYHCDHIGYVFKGYNLKKIEK